MVHSCAYDYVEVAGQKYCGDTRPSPITSQDNTMKVCSPITQLEWRHTLVP